MSPFELERNKKSPLVKTLERLALTRVIFTLIVLVVLVGAGYVAKTNAAAGQGYAMKELEKHLVVLEHENEKLELDIATLSSSKIVRQRAQQLGFGVQGGVEYVGTGAAVVARR